jgi:hypothetical protein
MASMLLVGTFGRQSPAGRRYHVRTMLALAVVLAGIFLGPIVGIGLGLPGWGWIPALAVAGAFCYVAHALWQYTSGLDELSRRLQLEAMSLTYLIGLALFMSIAGLSFVIPALAEIPAWSYLVLDVIRGGVLFVVARRFA